MFLAGGTVAAAITFAVVFDDAATVVEINEDSGSLRHTVRGDSSEFSLHENGLMIKAEWRGDIKLDESGDAVMAVDDFIIIELKEGGVDERVRIEKDGRKIETAYWREGEEQEPGPEANARVQDVMLRFLRASGFEADRRVKKHLAKGGVDAVLAEIDNLKSDYAIQRYAAALSTQEKLSTEDVGALVDKLKKLKGDHDLALALKAIVAEQDVDKHALFALLSVADMLDSDYEKRKVLAVVAERPLTGEAAAKALSLLETMDSDYDYRVAAEALLTHDELETAIVARLISGAGAQLDSDHDLRLVLTKATERLGEPEIADAWIVAFGGLSSDYDQRVALEAAAATSSGNEVLKARLREASTFIGSDYDRDRALEALK